MDRIDHLYYEGVEASKEALAHHLFAEAHQALSTALCCAFDLQDATKLLEVEEQAQEQLQKTEEYFAAALSPLEPEEVSNYRALVELAANYLALVQSASLGTPRVVTTSHIEGHRFTNTTTLDAQSKMPMTS